ncbi:MAG TPA: phosphoenolpyruvate--protein phosphotransferase [Gemmatimonadales bacterium]
MTRLIHGIPVSRGIAVGPALVVRWEVPSTSDHAIVPAQVEGEVTRLKEALGFAKERLAQVRDRAAVRAGPEEARIFDAQLLILDDIDLVGGSERLIRDNHFTAERAFELKMMEWRGLWSTQGSQLLRDRLIDLTDVEIRVLTRLLGIDEPDVLAGHDGPVILVARELTPSLTVQLDRDAVLAIATEQGTRTSHAAILAHSIGIPAVVGLPDVLGQVKTGEMVVLDGWAGTLKVGPSAADLEDARSGDARHRRLTAQVDAIADQPPVTTDGTRVTLRANLDLPEELDAATHGRAEGIGLMRTEFLVVGRGRMPSEDEQAALYQRIGERFPDGSVIIRTYDLGGDKFPAAFRMAPEPNPFLGWRAIRVCLDHPEIFRPQIRAILRAANKTPVKLMIPLVTRVEEVLLTRAMVQEEAAALASAGIEAASDVPVGVMIETPAAVVIADRLAEVSDFLSVGTNDLVQYTLAVDRGNARLADRFTAHHPAILRSLAAVLEAGSEAKIEVSVCGEMASDPISSWILLGLGYRVLSVAPPNLTLLRWLIRCIAMKDAATCARELLQARTTQEVTAAARAVLGHSVDLALIDPTA